MAKQIYIHQRSGQIWHDLDWVYHGLQARGLARVLIHMDIEGESQALVERPSDARSSGDALAPPQGCLQGLVEKPSDARSCGDAFAPPQGCSQAEAWEAPSRSASNSTLCTIDLTEEEPLLPIRSPPSLTQQQVHRMFNAADQRNFGWALDRIAGIHDIDTTRHPHA